jgi:hypothetical protein
VLEEMELLLHDLERLWIEYEVYKAHAEALVPAEKLKTDLAAARGDRQKLAQIQNRFAVLGRQLREMAKRFGPEDLSKGPPN